jgi:extracellular factor (EF) 3-hydroxypalmitic acid methyl ester biosynthesis protein
MIPMNFGASTAALIAPPQSVYEPISRNLDVLDSSCAALQENDVSVAFGMLLPELERRRISPSGWQTWVDALRAHPLHRLLLHDPYTLRAYTKPRGFAGDAELIDFIYDQQPPSGTTDLAHRIFAYTTSSRNAQAVRARRQIAAEMLEQTLIRGGSVCALACGHLREADLLGRGITNLVAVDQDPRAIEFVDRAFGKGTETIQANALVYLRRSTAKFDLIYALGLLDYLNDRQAELLMQLASRRLRPGGRLLVGNFVPDNAERGYMEAAMNWHLILRSEQDLLRIARLSPADKRTFSEATGNIAFLELAA